MRSLAIALVMVLFASGAQAAGCEVLGGISQALADANRYRAAAGAPPLKQSAQLQKSAQAFACDMARRKYFAHRSPEGQGIGGRTRAVGFNGRCVGENIAHAEKLAMDSMLAMQRWKKSPGHRTQLLAKRYELVGLAGAKSGRDYYWVMQFGGCQGTWYLNFP